MRIASSALILGAVALAACAPAADQTADQTVELWVAVAEPDLELATVRAASDAATVELIFDRGVYRGELTGLATPQVISATGLDPDGRVVATARTARVEISDDTVVALRLTSLARAPKNRAPVIDSLVASALAVAPGGTITLTATAHDPDADPLAFAWSGPGAFDTPAGATTAWTAPAATGAAKLSLTVTDPRGASDTLRITIAVKLTTGAAKVIATFETAPQISRVTLDTGRLQPGVTSKLVATAFDPDGDTLTYAWSAGCPATLTGSGNTIWIRVPATTAAGSCVAHVEVDDGTGLRNTGELGFAIGAPVAPEGAPVIDTTFQSIDRAGAGEPVVLRATAHDPAGGPLTFAWSADRGALAQHTSTPTTTSATWLAPSPCFAGIAELELATTASSGATAITTFAVTGQATCP